MDGKNKVYNFLNEVKTYYIATIEGNKPHVRPFGTILLFNDKLYIQTGKGKKIVEQIRLNPNVEICAFDGKSWVRISAELVSDNNYEAKVKMLEKMPELKSMYSADNDSMELFYLKNATATFSSFTSEAEVIEF